MSGNAWNARYDKALFESARVNAIKCVFISYRSSDRDAAGAIAAYLASRKVAYWLDVESKEVQTARAANDDLLVAQAIERALDVCSHLLGLVTRATRESQWVPYEIGSARGRGRSVGHVIHQDVPESQIPAFLKLGTPIPDKERLDQWLRQSGVVRLEERTMPATELGGVLPRQRTVTF